MTNLIALSYNEVMKEKYNAEYHRKYNKEHIEQRRVLQKEYRARLLADPIRLKIHKEKLKAWQDAYRLKVRRRVLTLYSGGEPKCAWCGEDRMDCLTIDHIQGDGAKQKRELGKITGIRFYLYIEKNYDPTRYQVLCMNCQWIKRMQNKESY